MRYVDAMERKLVERAVLRVLDYYNPEADDNKRWRARRAVMLLGVGGAVGAEPSLPRPVVEALMVIAAFLDAGAPLAPWLAAHAELRPFPAGLALPPRFAGETVQEVKNKLALSLRALPAGALAAYTRALEGTGAPA